MKLTTALKCCVVVLGAALTAKGQDTTNILPTVPPVTTVETTRQPAHLFYAPRLINSRTVYMMPKGILEFKVSHNFNDIAGDFGGIKNFFGLDDAVDIRLGFQYGISNRLNVELARYKGEVQVQRIYEIGLKWLMLQQIEKDPAHPISVAWYGNVGIATMKASTNPNSEAYVQDFSDRVSNLFQLMIAKKMGPVTLQVTPSWVYRNNILPYDQKSVFALGGASRIHLGGRYSILVDYFHSFRDQDVVDSFAARDVHFYDVFGLGFEILTEGHVFQLNFTNATDILENRFIPRTTRSWGKGQFRWGFTIARDFDLFWKKRRK